MSTAASNNVEKLFNSPLETGLRLLIILDRVSPQQCDLTRLGIYEYLLVHSSDVPDGPNSLHPPTPFRSSEIFVRRRLIERGLRLLESKGLVERSFSSDGIVYFATPLSKPFLSYFESTYFRRASEIASWLANSFQALPIDELRAFIESNLGKWRTEFSGESLAEEDAE